MAIFFLFILLLAPPAWADTVRETLLPNGLKVLTLEDHTSPVVTVQVWFRVGSRDEIPGKTGLSHLLEHMMFKGTHRYGKGKYSRVVARNGGNQNAFTSRDYTAYFQNFASDHLALALEMEADRMVNLLLDPKEFDLERQVVMEERRTRTEDDPTSLVVEEMFAAAYKVHPYGQPVIGWMDDLKALTLEDLKRHYRTYYVPSNAVLIIVGDFQTKLALELARRTFGAIPRGAEPRRRQVVEPSQIGERRVYVRKEAELPFVFAGYRVPSAGHGDAYALDVLETLVSAGKSSRLYRSLVYEKQMATYVGGSYNGVAAGPTLFYVYGGLRPEVTPHAFEEALYSELKRLAQEPVSRKELQKAKNQIEASFVMSHDSTFYRAMRLGRLETIGVGYRYLETYLDRIRAVTADDVQRVVKTYLMPDHRTVGVLVPKPRETVNR